MLKCNKCSCKFYPQDTNYNLENLPKRKIAVVFESPSATELNHKVKNKPYQSNSKRVLMDTLKTVGMPYEESEVYYTTAVKCVVPKIKGKKFPSDAPLNCRDALVAELREVGASMILVCGATALQTLTGKTNIKITTEYGRVKEYDFLPGITVIPIMNPGALLHKPGDYKPFLAMVQLAATLYKGGSTVDTGETKYTVLHNQEEVRDLWHKMKIWYKKQIEDCKGDLLLESRAGWVSFDIETTGLDYRIVELLVVGICFEKNHVYVLPRELQGSLHNFIAGADWKCVWQGGKYDKKVCWRRGLSQAAIDEDTMYLHYVLDETSEHNLEYLSKVFLNAEAYKYKMNQNWSSGSITLETYPQYFDALCERVAVDCDYTLQLCHKFHEILAKEENANLLKLYRELIIPAANFLSRVEQNGLLIDKPYLEAMGTKYEGLLEVILQEIQDLAKPFWNRELYMAQMDAKSASINFNPASPKQMSWMVFNRLKLSPRIKKQKKTDKDVLSSIENPPMLITKVLEYRSVQKEYSTYVKGLLNAVDEDGRVRSTFNLQVTATGRLSSKEPNVQNQPSANGVGNIRKAFIEDEGFLLAEIDYSGAELRWLAYLSKCPVLSEVFQQGRNLHHETAVALFGEHYSKKQKMRAKAVNFG